MAALFLIVLVVAWVAICLPAATRARDKGPLESTALFKRGLELIGPDHHAEFVRTLGRPPAVARQPFADPAPAPPSVRAGVVAREGVVRDARRHASSAPLVVARARTILLVLLAAFVVGSAVLALARGAWELHLAADSLLAIYISWLLEEKHKRAERRRKVRSLRSARRLHQPEPLRVAAGER